MKTKSLMLAALSTLLLGLLPNIAKAATMTQASTSVDLAAQTVSFQIVWNSFPDFLSVDSVGRPADLAFLRRANRYFLCGDLGHQPDAWPQACLSPWAPRRKAYRYSRD
jgi:hypothetical protein